jgi:hypothetical protein
VQVSFEEGSQLARQLGSAFFVELSAKEENVEEPFAQCVRYLLAHEASAAPLSQSTHTTLDRSDDDDYILLLVPMLTCVARTQAKARWRRRALFR